MRANSPKRLNDARRPDGPALTRAPLGPPDTPIPRRLTFMLTGPSLSRFLYPMRIARKSNNERKPGHMLEVTIERVALFAGKFPLDLERPLNGRELHLIKQVAGVRMGEITDALDANDYDMVIALAAIALIRSDRVKPSQGHAVAEELMDADMGLITISEIAEEKTGPPTVPPSGGSDETSIISSEASPTISDVPQVITPVSTGTPG